MNNVGENIKKLRIAKGLLQEQLAKLLGKKKGVVSKMENGAVVVSMKDAIKLSKIFEVSIDDLVNGNIDAEKVVAAKKIELSHYSLKSLHPFLDTEYSEVPGELKDFGKAVMIEAFNNFTGTTIEKIKFDIITELILEYKRITTTRLTRPGISIEVSHEVNKIIIEGANQLLSNHVICKEV